MSYGPGWDEAWLARHTAKPAETPKQKAVRGARKAFAESGEDAVSFQCKALGLPLPAREVTFHPARRWRFDFAWPDLMIALEQEGIVYPKAGQNEHRLGGRHVSVKGFRDDLEKYREAFRLGWRVLRVLPEDIINGNAVTWLEPELRKAK